MQNVGRGSVSIDIAASPAAVFAVLSDVQQNASWASASIDGHQTSPGPVGVGTTARETSRFLGRRIVVDSTIVAFEPGRSMRYVTSNGPFAFEGSFAVEPLAGGTRLDATFDVGLRGALRIVDPLVTVLARRQFAHDLANLKSLMEGAGHDLPG